MTTPHRIAIVVAFVSAGCMAERRSVDTSSADTSSDTPPADTSPEIPSTSIALSVALPQTSTLAFACFDVLIRNGAGEIVAEHGDPKTRFVSDTPDTTALCSSTFGDVLPKALTFHLPCDADNPDHTVTIWVDGLYVDGHYPDSSQGPIQREILDPCPNGCSLPVTCTESAVAPVAFNLAIMPLPWVTHHPAFVFGEVFCDTKVDCKHGEDAPIEFLFNPATQERDQTVVLALACGASSRGELPALFLDSVVIDCDGHTTMLDPALHSGAVYTESHPDPDPEDAIWQYAVFSGTESLGSDGTFDKLYWNIAVGFDPETPNCTLTAAATTLPASIADFTTPPATTWPFFSYEVQLTGPNGGLVCGQNQPEVAPAPITIVYTPIDTPRTFCDRFAGDNEAGKSTYDSCAP